MLGLLFLAAAAAASPPANPLAEAEHAIAAGRLEQARSMLSAAISGGASGDQVERLLADIAYETGNNAEALARYKELVQRHPHDSQLVERALVCAVKLRQADEAKALADRAIALPGVSWRVWNARGVIADLQRDFETADRSYERALELAAAQPEVLNNLGWSRLLRGDWQNAVGPLEQAVVLMPQSIRASNNLELARAALDNDLPERRPGESDDAWATRLNDAGVAAQVRGERGRAVAAFARALEARAIWYERAANNLHAASTGQ